MSLPSRMRLRGLYLQIAYRRGTIYRCALNVNRTLHRKGQTINRLWYPGAKRGWCFFSSKISIKWRGKIHIRGRTLPMEKRSLWLVRRRTRIMINNNFPINKASRLMILTWKQEALHHGGRLAQTGQPLRTGEASSSLQGGTLKVAVLGGSCSSTRGTSLPTSRIPHSTCICNNKTGKEITLQLFF